MASRLRSRFGRFTTRWTAEGCSEDKGSNKCYSVVTAHMKWRAMNIAAFLACTSVLLYQSSEFCRRYYEYPTNIKIEKTSFSTRDSFPLPAVTVCYENISRNKFCDQLPDLCQNVTQTWELCQSHPYFCSLTSDIIRFPKLGFFTDDQSTLVHEKAFELFTNGSYTFPFLVKPTLRTVKSTFVNIGDQRFAQCYTDNLHLYDSKKERIFKKREMQTNSAQIVTDFELKIVAPEVLFTPWIFPHAYFAIHSPFEPINPVHSGERLRLGKNCFIKITRLEEDHLLPAPYQTDCMDYEAINKANKEAGPRSQEACLDSCRAEQYKKCGGCIRGLRMFENVNNYCDDFYPENDENFECFNDIQENMPAITENCHTRCKPDCRKLKYHYRSALFTVRRLQNDSLTFTENLAAGIRMRIKVSIRNPDIFVLSHVAKFGSEELFSYVGGLMGCWLGISVWSFTDILEKNFRKVMSFKANFRKREKQSTLEQDEAI